MRKTLTLLLAVFLPGSALAGEERSAAAFVFLAKNSDKVFVGKVSSVEARDQVSIVSVRVVEGWANAEAGETVKLLAFPGVAHGGDPTALPAGVEWIFYVRKAPARYSSFGPDLYLPSGGEASLVPLQGSEGEEVRRSARLFAGKSLPPGAALAAQLESPSERVRENALAALSWLPEGEVASQAPQLLRLLEKEPKIRLRSVALTALAKAKDPAAISSLVSLAVEKEPTDDLVPLVAQALNRIDPEEAVRQVQTLSPLGGSLAEGRALALLGRIESPEALGELVRRVRKTKAAAGTIQAFSTLGAGQGGSELRRTVLAGSLEERKAAAFSLLRWGSPEDKQLVGAMGGSESDPAMRAFLKRLLAAPFLSYAELGDR